MFIGEYKHSIDAKGRLAVPAKLRTLLSDGAVVTNGLDNCLFLFPKKKWGEWAEKLANLPFISQSSARDMSRFMLGGAMDVDFDNQGRITLPEYLRKYAGLKSKAVIVGLYDHLEIWEEKAWEKYRTGVEKKSGVIAKGMEALGV